MRVCPNIYSALIPKELYYRNYVCIRDVKRDFTTETEFRSAPRVAAGRRAEHTLCIISDGRTPLNHARRDVRAQD